VRPVLGPDYSYVSCARVRVRERPVHDSSIVGSWPIVKRSSESMEKQQRMQKPILALCRPLTLKRANESATERILLVSLASRGNHFLESLARLVTESYEVLNCTAFVLLYLNFHAQFQGVQFDGWNLSRGGSLSQLIPCNYR